MLILFLLTGTLFKNDNNRNMVVYAYKIEALKKCLNNVKVSKNVIKLSIDKKFRCYIENIQNDPSNNTFIRLYLNIGSKDLVART